MLDKGSETFAENFGKAPALSLHAPKGRLSLAATFATFWRIAMALTFDRPGPCRRTFFGVVAMTAVALSACGGGSGDGDPNLPAITAQPQASTVAFGSGAVFRVTSTGIGLSYQWQVSTDGGATWTNIAGAIAALYEIALVDLSLNGYLYRAVISSGGSTVTTSPAQLSVSRAPLQPRLSGAAFYQPQINATIIANANLAATLPLGVAGIAADGTMLWSTATVWIQALNAAHHLGYSDWRLPKVGPINGASFVVNNLAGDPHGGYSGKIDLGYGISAPGTTYSGQTASELPFLFYNALGSVAKFSPTGVAQNSSANTDAPLVNVAPGNSWTSQPYGATGAYAFDMQNGNQNAYVSTDAGWRFNVIVFRTGDSAN